MDEAENLPSAEFSGDDGFALVASPATSNFHAPYVRFVKGVYECGPEKELIPLGTEYITVAATEGWVRLVRGEPVRRIPREPGQPFPTRNELGDTDQSVWPLFDGTPSDPWMLSNELFLVEKETGRSLIFSTTSWTGREAVADLCRLVTYQRRSRGAKTRPIIALGVGTYRSRRGPVATPKFSIVHWIVGDISDAVAVDPPQSQPAMDLTAHLEKRSAISPTADVTGAPAPSHAKPTPPSWDSDNLDDELPW
jgi:hypothetical protein